MALARFFLTSMLDADAGPLPLTDDDAHHLMHVRRARPGDRIVGVEPDGTAWVLAITSVGSNGIDAQRLEPLAAAEDPQVTLVIGVAKGEKTDLAIQGAVEVGVTGVAPVLFERCVVRLDVAKRAQRAERWRRVAAAAAKQAQRSAVPSVSAPLPLVEALGPILLEHDVVLAAWEDEESRTVRQALSETAATGRERVAVVVGPEGGLAPGEVEALRRAGALTVTLGPSILRSETAGVVAAALVLSELRAARERGEAG